MNLAVTIKPFVPNFLHRFFSLPITQKTSAFKTSPQPSPATNLEEAFEEYKRIHSQESDIGQNPGRHDKIITRFIKSTDDCQKVMEHFPNDLLLERLCLRKTNHETIVSDILIFETVLKRP